MSSRGPYLKDYMGITIVIVLLLLLSLSLLLLSGKTISLHLNKNRKVSGNTSPHHFVYYYLTYDY
jgi:hypothetical protein